MRASASTATDHCTGLILAVDRDVGSFRAMCQCQFGLVVAVAVAADDGGSDVGHVAVRAV